LASKVIIRSRFKEAGEHARKQTHEAVSKALEAGEREANIRLERANSARGYNLPANVQKSPLGYHSGKIEYPEFYGRFFEYGTVYIDAMPFMRPGHRKMRKVFKEQMGGLFKGWRRV
jgi:HK97 gp10 family phage protein